MRQISIYEAPIEINGLLSDYHKGHLWKMPEELWGKISDWIDMMGIRATGGRVRFRTNSKKLYLRSKDERRAQFVHLKEREAAIHEKE